MMKRLDLGFTNLYPTTIYLSKISKEDCETILTGVMSNEVVTSPGDDEASVIIHKIPRLKELAEEKFAEYLDKIYGISLYDYDFKFKSWLTGNSSGYSMDTHNHAGSPFIAVFYIMAEHDDRGGEIVFSDPRTNANRGYTLEFQPQFKPTVHMPQTGDVIIFPGFLYHHVRRYDSTLRIALPVDLFLYDHD
jgi:Putative 2OG-Fe(II) oxygenase